MAGTLKRTKSIHSLDTLSITDLSQFLQACKNGEYQVVFEFLEAGLNPSFVYQNLTPLFVAIQNGHYGVAKLLLCASCSIDRYSFMLVFEALLNNKLESIEIMQLMIDGNVTIPKTLCKPENRKRFSIWKEMSFVRVLHQKSIKLGNWRDYEQKSLLHFAALGGHLLETRILIENGCDSNQRDIFGFTPLHCCCLVEIEGFKLNPMIEEHILVASHLIQNGAELNSIDFQKGETPLHLAAKSKNFGLVRLLLSHGASTTVKDHDKKTPMLWWIDRATLWLVLKGSSFSLSLSFIFHLQSNID